MNIYHDQGKSSKGQYLRTIFGAGLQVQRFNPLSSREEHGAGGAVSSNSCSEGRQEKDWPQGS